MLDLTASVKMCAVRQTMSAFVLSTNFYRSPFLMQRTTLTTMMMVLLLRGFCSRLTFLNFVSANYFSSVCALLFSFKLKSTCLDDTEMVLSGRWGLHEDTLRDNIWKTLGTIQEHKKRLINFDPDEFKQDEIHVMSVDCVNYLIEEPRIQPSTKWFDPKSKSAGFKYEYAMPLTLKRVSNFAYMRT